MDAVSAYDLTKEYGGVQAVAGLQLQVPVGSRYACIGTGNSGKTTLLRLLAGLCTPTFGECSVMGVSPSQESEKLHAKAGVVLETSGLYRTMTVEENLAFFAAINCVDKNDSVDRISFLLHQLDIWEWRNTPVGQLSTGALWRASVARALVHSPKILLLDDPAEGLDLETMEATRSLLLELCDQEGLTLFLCTRDAFYAQSLCTSFAFLKKGHLLAKGTLESLCQNVGFRKKAVLSLKSGAFPGEGYTLEGERWVKDIDSREEMPGLISALVTKGIAVYEASVREPSLQDAFQAFLNRDTMKKRKEEAERGTEGKTNAQ
jgi:ABC-2 type transport system ATP-binding protein